MNAQKMDRGTDACVAHLGPATEMEIRQTRRGCFQELLGCEAQTEFKHYIGGNHVATSLEESSCLCRLCFQPCHPFTMSVKENSTEAELLTVERPFRCATGACKCCCYQEANITSGGQLLGNIKEDCYFCVPSFTVNKADGQGLYVVHPPTCCGNMCVNICAEGNPCGKGCCKVSFRVYPFAQKGATGGDAPYIGKILKKPKSMMVEVFTDSDAFEVTFPEKASVDEKAILVGSTILLNAVFFESDNSDGAAGLAA